MHFGNENSLKEDRIAAGMLGSMMMSGTKRLDRQALQQELDALGVRIGPGGGGGRRGGGRGGRGGVRRRSRPSLILHRGQTWHASSKGFNCLAKS